MVLLNELILLLKEFLLLEELLLSLRRDCDISVVLVFGTCGFNAEDSKDGFLGRVGSIDR